MINFTQEGFSLKTGINFVRISDGGFAIKFVFKNRLYSFRVRNSNLKPRFLFSKVVRY